MTSVRADYVIVGAGTAGLVVANRLSEDASASIIVLEAGQNQLDNMFVNIPAFWMSLLGGELDWQLQTVPQQAAGGRTINLPQGKLFGGSSGLNGQTLVAPSKAGLDAWAKMGNPGWTWSDLLPYYKKFYTLHLPDEETRAHLGIEWVDPSVHGTSGPIQASFTGVKENAMAKAWIDTFKKLGADTTADPFSGASTGGYSNFSSVDPNSHTRSYAGSQYGRPLLSRPNVQVIFGAEVQKIDLSSSGSVPSATGVTALVDGQIKTFTADKEVILSAGVYQSPKLLELSGIGNPKILRAVDIDVKVDLPGVGENLQDHLMSGISYEVIDGVPSADPLSRQEPAALQQAQELYAQGKGPFCAGGIGSHAYLPILEFATPEGKQQQIALFDKHPASSTSDQDYYNIVREIVEQGSDGTGALCMFHAQVNFHEQEGFASVKPENYASLGPLQSHPFSKGNVHISSKDPAAKPKVDPRFFSHPLDLEFMARHLLFCEQLRNTDPLSNYFKPDGKRNHEQANIKSLEDAKQYLLDTAQTTYHGCGSNAMLPKDKGGVVDSALRVHGVKGLRIVDASIIPLIPRGNIMSTVYAIGEKAADLIKSAT